MEKNRHFQFEVLWGSFEFFPPLPVCKDQRSGPSPVLVHRCSLIMMQETRTYLNKLLFMIKENNASDEAEVLSACAAGQRGRGAAGFHLTEVLITDGRSRVR